MEQMFKSASQIESRKEIEVQIIGSGILFFLVLLVFLCVSFFSNGQTQKPKSILFSTVSPVSDHYKEFASISAATEFSDSGIDTISFPVKEFKWAAYLSLPRNYLNVPVEAFSIKPFPANSSKQTKAELDFLLQLQQIRTVADIHQTDLMAEVYYDPLTTNPEDPDISRNINSLFFIGRSLGNWFTPQELPITTSVLQKVLQDATFYFFSLKANFNRARPYHLEPALLHLEAPGHGSYPSGHSSASYVHAYLLSELFPAYENAFFANAYDMAFSREVHGVHYPSDSEAGRVFAQQFVAFLLKSDKFQKDYGAMQRELADVSKRHEASTYR